MSAGLLDAFLFAGALYWVAGLVFALRFAFVAVNQIDPHAAHGTWGFRLIILPGASLLWPFLLWSCLRATGAPPEERTAHRHAARL
jgi:hypothetical protein